MVNRVNKVIIISLYSHCPSLYRVCVILSSSVVSDVSSLDRILSRNDDPRPIMIRPRLRAFLPISRPTSFFHFNHPLSNPKPPLPSLRWQVTWSAHTPRRIDAKFFSSHAMPGPAPEIVPPRAVGYWLLGSAGLVFAIVVVGGLTRLTESGYLPLLTGTHPAV
jgi:hypothetical protein